MKFVTDDDRTWEGARVTVMGLGLFGGGVGAAQFAVGRGAHVIVTDLRSEDKLAESLNELVGLPIRYVLGRHDEEDFIDADVVIASPAVPLDSHFLAAARSSGVSLTTEILLFAERCRGDVVAVTGSNGKTTTTSLLGDIFARHNNATVVGGNLGKSLLGSVDQITPGTPVILELSSFQLEWLGPAGWYPQIGVITNLSPNHLDRHGTFEAYVRAKRQLIANQPPGTSMVLNARDPHLQSFANGTRARVVWFDGTGQKRTGSWLQDGRILLSLDSTVHDVMPASEIPLLGMHNCENVLAAVAAAGLAGIPAVTISQAIQEFQPVEHRLEFVAEIDGVRYFNDSIATTPESAICALRSFAAGTLILIAGGYDKKIPFDELGAEIAVRAGALITLGATADKIAQAARERGFPDASVFSAGNLQNAVAMAARIARVGQCVSLSPACASYDQFRNFEERGHSFKQLVHQLSS